MFVLGAGKSVNCTELNVAELLGPFFNGILPSEMEIQSFLRIRLRGIVVHSKLYSCVKKRNSYTVQYGCNEYGFVHRYLVIHSLDKEFHIAVVEKLKCIDVKIGSAKHMKVIEKQNNATKIAVPIENIIELCTYIDVPGLDFGFISHMPYNFLAK
jgi:hypothetical protein